MDNQSPSENQIPDRSPTTALFLDTNIFMHFKPLKDHSWLNVIGRDPVKVVIHPHHFRELNRVKDGFAHPIRAKKRAESAIKQIGQWFEAGLDNVVLQPNVNVIFEPHFPARAIFDEYDLTRDETDDSHLAAIFAYQKKHPDQRVVFLSNDIGARLRAQSLGISQIKPPLELRLPEDLDPLEVRANELQAKVDLYEQKVPLPRLRFDRGGTTLQIFMEQGTPEDIEEEEYSTWLGAGPQEMASNREDTLKLHYLRRRILFLGLELHNSGGSPALEVRAFLSLENVPGLIDVISSTKLELYWRHPEIRSQLEIFEKEEEEDGYAEARHLAYLSESDLYEMETRSQVENEYISNFSDRVLNAGTRTWDRNIADTEISPLLTQNRINLQISSLPQHLPHYVNPIYLVFASEAAMKSFNMTYTLISASISQPVVEQLNVAFK